MTKLVYILWQRVEMSPAERRVILVDQVAKTLLARRARYVQMNVDDDRVGVKSPAPRLPLSDEPFVAQVNVWCDEVTDRHPFEDALRAAGFDIAGYLVDEQLYTEYGEHPPHGDKRTWPDGERSPGVTAVTLLERPAHLAKDEWMRRWFGRQSPMSEWMQPRARYVRNVVLQVLTEGAFPYEGIVEEAWPTAEDVTNPMRFYGATNAFELVKNLGTMLSSVASFLPIWKIPNVMTSEYFVKSPFAEGKKWSSPVEGNSAQ